VYAIAKCLESREYLLVANNVRLSTLYLHCRGVGRGVITPGEMTHLQRTYPERTSEFISAVKNHPVWGPLVG